MRRVLLAASVLVGACASWDDDVCRDIDDSATRQACIERVLADDHAQQDNNGIGPPSCHPASTRPDPDRDPC